MGLEPGDFGMRIVVILSAAGLVAASGAALSRPAAAQAPAAGFCANLKLAFSHAPTGFKEVRGHGRLTSHPNIPEQDFEHATSITLQPGGQCLVRSRYPGHRHDGLLSCLSYPASAAPDAKARAQALLEEAKACLPKGGSELPVAPATWHANTFDAELRRNRVVLTIQTSPYGDYLSVGHDNQSQGIYRPKKK
jgi:hypothetical protein